MERYFLRKSANSPTVQQRKGFALIAVISILVLLALIAVGLLGLSTTTIRSSTRDKNAAVARSNARMALMLAIGQLQKYAGDDRRITMAADQQSSSADGSSSSAADERRRWTGVYEAWEHDLEARPTPEFLSWLVSSSDPGSLGESAPSSAGGTDDSVVLVGSGTLGSGTTDTVEVPLIQMSDKTGGFAWWTGDQGLKAMVALPEPAEPIDLAGARARMQSAPINAIDLATTEAGAKPFSGMDFRDERLGAITDWPQAGFFAASPDDPKPLFHDLATLSSGLLTNVREGGFRKDLSMALERRSTAMPTYALYEVGGEPGINMEELGAYYNLYKEVGPGRGSFTTGGRIPSNAPSLTFARNADECKTDYEHHFKMPLITSYQMAFSFESRSVRIGRREVQRMHLVADPIITLWNPLDVPVVIPKTAFLSVKYWQLPYDMMVRVDGGRPLRCPLVSSLSGASLANNADANYLTIRAGELEQLVFKPGEVIKVSQSGSTIVKNSNKADHSLQGRSGFNYGGGVSLPLRSIDGRNVDLTGSERITYEVLPNNITCGKSSSSGNSLNGKIQHSRHFSLNHHEYYVGTDRKTNTLGIGGMYIDFDFGNQRLLRSAPIRERNSPGTKPSGERIYADDHPDVFRPITYADTRELSASELNGRKAPFMLVSYNAKTENGSDLGTKSLARLNPRAFHVDFYDLSPAERDTLPYEFSIEPLNSWKNRSLETSANGNAYFGGGLDAYSGSSFVATHSVPHEPLASLAALQHSCANGFPSQLPRAGYVALNGREPMLPQVSHAIGNSFAPSVMKPTETESTLSGGRPMADHSYLANRELWDDWFFSSLAPRTSAGYVVKKGQRDLATDFFNGTDSLANSRYVPDLGGQEVDELINRLFSRSTPTEDATELIASLLRVEGMFNVNSTSVEAWKVILSGLNNRAVVTHDGTGAAEITTSSDGIPVAGLVNPLESVADGSGSVGLNDWSQWAGRRVLTEDEVEELAEAIVREVRRRGPFLSLADFVNRRVGSDRDLARSGAIQSALDSSDVSINDAFQRDGREVLSAAASRFPFPEAEEGPISQGIAGIVKQADILTPIAPVLSARSDSFIIRTYGEATSPSGDVLARAWCEAVVERESAYVSADDEPEVLPDDLKSAVNEEFGRKYRVRTFRWLSADEV